MSKRSVRKLLMFSGGEPMSLMRLLRVITVRSASASRPQECAVPTVDCVARILYFCAACMQELAGTLELKPLSKLALGRLWVLTMCDKLCTKRTTALYCRSGIHLEHLFESVNSGPEHQRQDGASRTELSCAKRPPGCQSNSRGRRLDFARQFQMHRFVFPHGWSHAEGF